MYKAHTVTRVNTAIRLLPTLNFAPIASQFVLFSTCIPSPTNDDIFQIGIGGDKQTSCKAVIEQRESVQISRTLFGDGSIDKLSKNERKQRVPPAAQQSTGKRRVPIMTLLRRRRLERSLVRNGSAISHKRPFFDC